MIIDEAQNLDQSTLEQIRLLSNFETLTEKLLQILLVGQPELKTKLEVPELHQLRQRISLRCSVPRLTLDESRSYIRHRLHIAGHKMFISSPMTPRSVSRNIRGVSRDW